MWGFRISDLEWFSRFSYILVVDFQVSNVHIHMAFDNHIRVLDVCIGLRYWCWKSALITSELVLVCTSREPISMSKANITNMQLWKTTIGHGSPLSACSWLSGWYAWEWCVYLWQCAGHGCSWTVGRKLALPYKSDGSVLCSFAVSFLVFSSSLFLPGPTRIIWYIWDPLPGFLAKRAAGRDTWSD